LSGGRLAARVVGVHSSVGRRGSLIETARIARATLNANVLARRIGDQGSARQPAGCSPQARLLISAEQSEVSGAMCGATAFSVGTTRIEVINEMPAMLMVPLRHARPATPPSQFSVLCVVRCRWRWRTQ
jgi:hypothetical protein